MHPVSIKIKTFREEMKALFFHYLQKTFTKIK